jgi:glycosyltransferase involved in cell wall biosynthesis
VRLAFVSAPSGNAFMAEILAAVADAVDRVGVETLLHTGAVDEVDDGDTAFVVIPHEYYWFNPRPSAEHMRRTIAFGVEHPGTDTFATAARASSAMAARVEISRDSVAVLHQHGVPAEHFVLGYSQLWDHWGGGARERPVELAYMGAADPERLAVLARLAPELAGVKTDLLIPPLEQRLQPRPDFLMGAAKWNFLAQTKILLNLHRQAKTALELVRTLEAICNGAVLLTEPSTDMGGLEPGVHLEIAPRESIAVRARELLGSPEQLERVSQTAYQFCKDTLDMTASAERLAAIAHELVAEAQRSSSVRELTMPDWPEVRPPYVPELAYWIPEPYPLPRADQQLADPVRAAMRELADHRRKRMALNDVYEGDAGDAEVDVIVVSHAATGPLRATLASLAAQSVPVNVHVAGIGIPMPPDTGPVASYLTCSPETSVGAARNELVERSSAAFLLVIDSGDEPIGDAIEMMREPLLGSSTHDVAYPMATYGGQMLVNLFFPEPARLERFAYLTRGYLLRRDALGRLGTYTEDPVLDAYVDHEFWLRVAGDPDRVSHLHAIGIALCPTDLAKLSPADPVEVRALLAARVGGVATAAAAAPARPDESMAPAAAISASPSALPKVSALMGAYNYSRYIVEAIDSAMQQDYPPELLELVVVDDGSTDNTAELVAACMERYPGRIKFIQQENAGATAATNRARLEASGDLIALLDADDVWLPHKTRRQVELMLRRPELGMVFSRMRIIDANGTTLQGNYGHQDPIPENGFARLLWENVAVHSSLIIAADLYAEQIPDEAPYADWWLSLAAAQHRRVDYLRDELVLYRWHDANITGGVGGMKALREGQKGIRFQRWVLRSFDLSEFTTRLTPAEMGYVWTGLENQAQKALTGLHSHFGPLATVTDEDRSQAARDAAAAERALTAGDFSTGCALLVRARAADPYNQELRELFNEAVNDAQVIAALADPLDGHQGFTVLADVDYLLGDDARLAAYAEAMRSVPGVALAIDASCMDPVAAEAELGALVERCHLEDDEDTLLIGIVGELQPAQRRRLARRIQAHYGPTSKAASGATPSFSPETLASLRELAARSG